jgi:hypothetical protein
MLAAGLLTALLVPVSSATWAQEGAAKSAVQEPASTVSNGVETQRIGDTTVQTDVTGKGAVLCVWGILEAVRAAGRECFKGQDAEFQTELDTSISGIDQFIIRNSSRPVTQAGLDDRRAQALKQLHSLGDICTGDAARMYEGLRARGVDELRANTTDMLSVPREPVINPCL